MVGFEIKPVSCMRGNLRIGFTYDAEIYTGYNRNQFVVGTGFKTADEAIAIASPIANSLNEQIELLIHKHLGMYPKAKP